MKLRDREERERDAKERESSTQLGGNGVFGASDTANLRQAQTRVPSRVPRPPTKHGSVLP